MTRRLTLIETPPAPTHRGEYDRNERSRAKCSGADDVIGHCPLHYPYTYADHGAKHRGAL